MCALPPGIGTTSSIIPSESIRYKERLSGILIDKISELDDSKTKEIYPRRLRRKAAYNEEYGFTVELKTNKMKLTASKIANLNKACWKIKMFCLFIGRIKVLPPNE